jgi:signal transduction histidine kinase
VFTALPVAVQDRVAGVVYASRTPNNVVRHLYDERRRLILAGLTVLAAALLLGWIFSRAITRPIHALVARTQEVGRGDRDALRPLAHHGTREIALLSQAFIDMAQRLRDRSDYIATFAAHVSHELKSPLTSIQGAAELLRDAEGTREAGGAPGLARETGGSPANLVEHGAGSAQGPSGRSEAGTTTADAGGGDPLPMSPAERRQFLDNIIADTARLTQMLHRLRELARADNPHREGSTTLIAVVADLERRFPALRIEAGGDLDRPMALSPENAAIVFSHLADNAVRHGSTLLRMNAEAGGASLRIELRDDGEGVSERNRDRIFDAFFTTRRESGGTGMGLGIARAMLQAHEGSIALLPSSSGAAFLIVVAVAR